MVKDIKKEAPKDAPTRKEPPRRKSHNVKEEVKRNGR